MSEFADIIQRCLSYGDEQEWFEFKDSIFKPDDIGQYISALSNAAVMEGEPFGYLIWGIDNHTHAFTDTKFNFQKDIKPDKDKDGTEPLQHYLSRNITPSIFFSFDKDSLNGHRVVILKVPAARGIPTEYKHVRYIRIGSSKEDVKRYPEREAALFRALNYGPQTILNTPSRFKNLTFNQLFVYYEAKGIRLREDTFKENLELLTEDGRYNILAQLLSDDPHIDIQFALFNGNTKASTMYAVRNFGHMCILLSLDKVLDYGDTLNVPQADERDRKVERKEVMLFDASAFREAVINAFVHNDWIHENAPMFSSYIDRLEIVSMGKLPPTQTKEGFYRGRSIPVNIKLSEIFVQLHISEKSGRGVPRIVEAYGKKAFTFEDHSIVVTLPYHRLDVDGNTDKNRSEKKANSSLKKSLPAVESSPYIQQQFINEAQEKVIHYCNQPRGILEIATLLHYKDKKTVHKYLDPLIQQGRIIMTIPDKPNSRNQKYIAVQ